MDGGTGDGGSGGPAVRTVSEFERGAVEACGVMVNRRDFSEITCGSAGYVSGYNFAVTRHLTGFEFGAKSAEVRLADYKEGMKTAMMAVFNSEDGSETTPPKGKSMFFYSGHSDVLGIIAIERERAAGISVRRVTRMYDALFGTG